VAHGDGRTIMKRSRIKNETQESKALKRMRVSRGLSQREAAAKIGVPSTQINHTENGRAYIPNQHIDAMNIATPPRAGIVASTFL
jgi:transcriptional regulator with XRE-family HTH domain